MMDRNNVLKKAKESCWLTSAHTPPPMTARYRPTIPDIIAEDVVAIKNFLNSKLRVTIA